MPNMIRKQFDLNAMLEEICGIAISTIPVDKAIKTEDHIK